MVRTRQQKSKTSAPIHEPTQGPTHNNQFSTTDEEEQTQWLTHVEQNLDAIRATMDRMEAALMYLTQCINSRAPKKPEAQLGPSNEREAHKSRKMNDNYRQSAEHSPQGLVSASTWRNEVASGRRASAS